MLIRLGLGGAAFTLGATLARLQIQAPQDEFNRRFDSLHQASATPVHRKRRRRGGERGGARAKGSQPPAAIKGFRLVLFLILLGIRMHMVKAVEAIPIHQEVGRTIEKDLALQLLRFADNSNCCRWKEFCEGEWAKKKGNQKAKRRNSQGKDPRTPKRNSQGKDPRTLEETARVGTP